jgi:hypothetical protein
MSGDYSTGIGSGLQSNSLNAFVIGQNNIIDNGNSTSWIPTDPLFIIGNGNTSQSNAVTVLKNGNVGINSIAPQTSLDVNGTGSFTGLRMPTGAGANLFLTSDATGTASWAPLPAAPAITQFWGGSLTGDVNNLNSGNVQIGPTPIGGLKSLRSKLEVYNNSATGFQVPIIAPVAYFQSNYGNQYFNLSLLNFSGSNPNQLLGANFFDGTNTHQLISISNTGSTIIGNTTSLAVMLDVRGAAALNGNVGIGVNPSPFTTYKLDVAGIGNFTGLRMNTNAGTGKILTSDASGNATWTAPSSLSLGGWSTNTAGSYVTNISANIAIGTTCVPPAGSPYKLVVNGTIVCKEMKVKLPNGTCFPDYVFEKNYNLITLYQLEDFIHANHHLPEMPTSEEVEQNGLEVSAMNVLLVKKIEELTLYTIELANRVKELENK